MTKIALLLTCCVLLIPSGLAGAAGPEDSVVKVFATVRYPNPIRPWAAGQPVEVAGSGTVIEGKKVLTNAHLVLYATELFIQARPGEDRREARVEGLAPDMDLALLAVKDDKFFEKRPALTRAKDLPKTQDSVTVYGFPVGGNDLSVTKGVVSRIDFRGYYDQGLGLIIQVSAAVNPGNSGGPAVVDNRMIGIVFSRLGEGENIGYVIPNEEIDLFLEDLKDGRYDGKPVESAGTGFQRLENEALRSFLKLERKVRGLVVVTSPMFTHRITKGYDDPIGQVVQEVNGVKVKNLRHLVEILHDSTDEYLTFRFAEEGAGVLVFNRKEMDRLTEAIMEDNGIAPTRRGSEDMLKVWKKQAAPPR